MVLIEVYAKHLRPGDVLCTQQDRDDVTHESTMNAWKIQSRAFRKFWEQVTQEQGYAAFWGNAHQLARQRSYIVEHVSYGPFRARIVLPTGAIVRFPKNAWVAVFRNDAA